MTENRGKFTWCDKEKKLIPLETKPRVETHGIIPDEICIKSMVDGRVYTSKSALRRHYREAGVIEVGNEINHTPKAEDPFQSDAYLRKIEEDAQLSYYAIRDGMEPLTELDKERCKLMDHNLEHYNYDRRPRDDDGNIIGG